MAEAASAPTPILLPDAWPLITLAYANALHLLQGPGWALRLVDMVLHELTRNKLPTCDAITAFVRQHQVAVIDTQAFSRYQTLRAGAERDAPPPRKAGLGELAMQEAINRLALLEPPQQVVLLFEDHKIARASFHVPESTLRVSTRAFLLFLQDKGWLDSAAEVERRAILAGRHCTGLRFP